MDSYADLGEEELAIEKEIEEFIRERTEVLRFGLVFPFSFLFFPLSERGASFGHP